MNNLSNITDCWNTIGVWGDQSPRCERLREITHCHNCKIYSQAGSQLLNRAAEEEYLTEWKKNLSQPREENNIQKISALVFRMGDEWFALESKVVKEITHCDKHHTLPHVNNKVLRGLVNVNGELVINISLGHLFNIEKSKQKNAYERYVIINNNDDEYAFPVSEVREIIHYKISDIKPTPTTINKDTSSFIKGILQHKNTDIGVLDSVLIFSELLKI